MLSRNDAFEKARGYNDGVLLALVLNVAVAAYAAAVVWGPLKKWGDREPPRMLRPTLEFWGLPLSREGYRRFNRACALLLLTFCAGSAVILAVTIVMQR
jgi:hypothetical protein